MGQSESKSNQKPKPGDLIEIFRGTYEHWAVYVGDGYVVHLTTPPGDEVPGIISDTLMSVPTEKAMVRKQKLQEAVGDSTWIINNSLDKKYKPCSPRVIVEEALLEVGKMMDYSVYSSNCEHFVNELRYGKAVSWQVLEAEQAIAATGVVAVGAIVAVAIAVVAVFIINGWTFSSNSPPV